MRLSRDVLLGFAGACLVVGVLTGGIAGALAPTTTAGSTAVELNASADPAVDETVTVRVVVARAPDGVGSYDLTVTSNDTAVAEIVAAEPLGTPTRNVTEVTADEATVFASGADTANGTDVTVATVTVRATATGTANLSLSVDALGDETGRSYAVTATDGVVIDVTSDVPVIVEPTPPTDPDGDGAYEDVTGDGAFGIVDVATFLNAFDGPADDPRYFDFDDDGRVSIADVAALLFEL